MNCACNRPLNRGTRKLFTCCIVDSSYSNSAVYRKGSYGYQRYVDARQYQYYFRQGFERGYGDGVNSRYENGKNDNGAINILGNVLENILTFESY